MKSKHLFPNGIIPYEELTNFVEPISVTLPVPLEDLRSIGGTKGNDFYNRYREMLNRIFNHMPLLDKKLSNNKDNINIISYTPHEDGYDFRINPINFINSILKELKYDEEIPFFNLDNDKDAFKGYTKSVIKKLKDKKSGEDKELLDELYNNVDYISSLYNAKVNTDIINNNFILAKDALLYLAYTSLLKYRETGKGEYARIPYEYYHYISHMETSMFPHKVDIGKNRRIWFDTFRRIYEYSLGKEYILEFNKYALSNHTYACGWEILKSGDNEEVFREAREAIHRGNRGLNDERNRKMYMMKTDFYQSSPYKCMIKGVYGLRGYIGFVYPNDYLVYDKFYNNDDAKVKTILSHPEAIYSVPSDKIIVTSYDKQTLKEVMKEDFRIVKNNHTMNGSFIEKIDKIIKGPNLSTKSFEEVVKEDNNKVLILR